MSTEKHDVIGPQPTEGHHSLMEIFDELTFREKWRKVFYGLRQPKDSGDYKYARLQLLRLMAPASAVAVPALLIMLMVTFGVTEATKREYEIQVLEPEAMEQLDEETEKLIEEIEPPEPIETEVPDEANINPEAISENVAPSTATDFSPQPAQLDSVAITKSPVVLRGILGSRNPGARGSALAGFGGSAATERSVLLSLRWLKKYQEPDGSWKMQSGGGPGAGATPAMTALGLLTFLAHGETPASEEFGPTVERAIKWLVSNQTDNGDFKEADGHNYSQPIAAYALCEAFALTRIPMVKTAAEKSIVRIVKGQNPAGYLWNYNFDPKSALPANSKQPDRNDLSFAGWCMQALKAASTAGIEVEGLAEAKKKAIEGIRKNSATGADGSVGFGYSGPSQDAITSAGTLCMMLLGAGKSKEVNGALQWLKRTSCDWNKLWNDASPIYHWYYITQVKFHAGGGTWAEWNKQFSPQLTKNQIVVKDAITDEKGKLADIGYWQAVPTGKEHCQSYVYNTTLCALMLQVYYRYLPTYKTPEAVEEAATTLSDENKDIDVQIL